jgi:hypothetical protein
MPHDAPDYFAMAISHIVIIRRPPLAATAFASGDQNKLISANPAYVRSYPLVLPSTKLLAGRPKVRNKKFISGDYLLSAACCGAGHDLYNASPTPLRTALVWPLTC